LRIKIIFESPKNIVLQVGFNSIIQWFIYSNIKDSWLHDIGFKYEKRQFKLFSFSSFLEKAQFINEKKLFIFPKIVSFIFSSPVDWIIENLASKSFTTKKISFWQNELYLSEVSVLKPPQITQNEIKIRAITPIEVHSTFQIYKQKKTYYYNPYEKEFSLLIANNAAKKWEAFYKKPPESELKLEPIGFNKEKIVRFGSKNSLIIKGWTGNFKLLADSKMLGFIIDAGLGNRNSQGFGMVEVIQ